MTRKYTLISAAAILSLGVMLAGCGSSKPVSTVPPPVDAASVQVPASVPPAQQEQARQQMMMSMQSGRTAAMHANGQH